MLNITKAVLRPYAWPGVLQLLLIVAGMNSRAAFAQENYEIQVYASETVKPGMTMVELHSNFTFQGSKQTINGMWPTNHALHETVEITHGFTPWFETGFYIFTAADPQHGWQWVGDHIRPRIAIPQSWKWPVGLSLSTEIGYQRKQYSPDTWTWEIRPIIDKDIGKFYLAFNPSVDRSFHGPGVSQGVTFSPNVKIGYDINKVVNAGIEYYGSVGPVTGFDILRDQEHQIIPCIDLNFGPQWEFNFGVGVGFTGSTDHLLVKMIVGRRFSFGSWKGARSFVRAGGMGKQ